MASLNLMPDEVRVIEYVRQRLTQVVNSLQSFKDDVATGQPLPPAASIQASTTIIQQNLRTLTTYLAENAVLLERVAVHPATNFPGRTQENVLLQLLRKKHEPSVEELFETGRETAAASLAGEDAWREQRELWSWARTYCVERIGQYAMEETNEVYTAEERELGEENVRTGLKRDLDLDEEEEDEEGEGEEVKGPVVPDEVRKMARLRLARDGVLGRFELPQSMSGEVRRMPGMPVRAR